jgi:subtilisin family serine protease
MFRFTRVVFSAAAAAVLMYLAGASSPTTPTAQGRRADAPGQALEPRFVQGEVLVQYRARTDDAAKQRARVRIGGERHELLLPEDARHDGKGDLELTRVPAGLSVAAAVRGLAEDADVEFAEPNWILERQILSNDPYYVSNQLWGMYGDASSPANTFGSQASEAWAAGRTGSRTVYVAVIDEGIQFTHPDLAANIWTNPFDSVDKKDNDRNGYKNDIHGWDFANNDNSIYDGGTSGALDTHGTHVSGTIGAVGGNGIGVAGVNWNVTLISAKFLHNGSGTLANAIKAINYITDLKVRHGLDIVATSNSWTGGGFSQAMLDAITAAATRDILFVAAAGNGGVDQIGDNNDLVPTFPASYNTTAGAGYDAVIAVAAINSAGGLAPFSNYGAASVDIGAPGVAILSTTAYNRYVSYSGTSMATPHVSGAVALYAASSSLRGAGLRNAILAAAIPTPSLAGRTVTGGRLDASRF